MKIKFVAWFEEKGWNPGWRRYQVRRRTINSYRVGPWHGQSGAYFVLRERAEAFLEYCQNQGDEDLTKYKERGA